MTYQLLPKHALIALLNYVSVVLFLDYASVEWSSHWSSHCCMTEWNSLPNSINRRVDRASATETVDSGSISGRVKPNTIKIGIYSFAA